MFTGIAAPNGLYAAGPLPEGEDMAVAEIDLSSIVRQKNVLDTPQDIIPGRISSNSALIAQNARF